MMSAETNDASYDTSRSSAATTSASASASHTAVHTTATGTTTTNANATNSSIMSRSPTGTASSTMSMDDGAALVRNIASFLTLSDATNCTTSLVSIALPAGSETAEYESDSWAIGEELEQLNTPATPALMAISPGATPRFDLAAAAVVDDHAHHHHSHHHSHEDDYVADEYELEELLQERKRRWAQERLAAAVFSHPQPLRSFCVEAFSSARELAQQKEVRPSNNEEAEDPETHHEPPTTTITKRQQQHNQHQQGVRPYRYHYHHRLRSRRKDFIFIHDLLDSVLHNVPLSVLLDFSSCAIDTYLESVHCTFRITATSVTALASALSHTSLVVWDGITNFNPFAVLDAIISLQVNAMGKTSEVLASGIQSVATGVGSASSLALHRLSRTGVGNLSVNRTGSSSSSLGGILLYTNMNGQKGRTSSSACMLQKKLLRKVSTINSAAEVISYMELEDDTGGLSRHAKSRVQRMMHYDVSLRPFVATIAMPPLNSNNNGNSKASTTNNKTFDNIEFAGQADQSLARDDDDEEGRQDDEEQEAPSNDSSPMDSPFMCTPQSFPPTPASRMTVLARSTRFADDVVFLARDKIRVHDALASDNERTREMARALSEGKRLAVFDAKDALNYGIELTCGQHLATKIGNMLYCSTRSMVPILRNCFVYFEMTVMPRPLGNVVLQASMITLSIGLSTEEMPPNTLVGAWSGSVGLCTTGQILTAGQWCSPGDPSLSSYADSATVGCLVCLDDGSAFETWDGVMITAQVTFNVNGRLVPPPVSTLPTTGGASGLLPGAQMQMGLINGSIGYDPLRQNPMVPTSTLPLLVPAAEELYPTVTLHSPASAVMCRFSAEDIVANSRESIGAPEGCTIYAVDGSVVSFSQD